MEASAIIVTNNVIGSALFSMFAESTFQAIDSLSFALAHAFIYVKYLKPNSQHDSSSGKFVQWLIDGEDFICRTVVFLIPEQPLLCHFQYKNRKLGIKCIE